MNQVQDSAEQKFAMYCLYTLVLENQAGSGKCQQLLQNKTEFTECLPMFMTKLKITLENMKKVCLSVNKREKRVVKLR